ncbi:hypothetical protein DEO72_LG1g3255 [Vigna unguiculata]|uniref:Uncharacterized protein n=1 Tax=Vigna unguiculata TaxID=3917 RepID=A0A4D6KSD4_VIGUN|nr:hypothetical protein DEO72_LG1g3255 [Vigna unguiculata]
MFLSLVLPGPFGFSGPRDPFGSSGLPDPFGSSGPPYPVRFFELALLVRVIRLA